jgi:FAD binding domain
MNTGMQDAFNLAWKLAVVANGLCGEMLLDSYSAERSEVGEQVLADAQRLTVVGTIKNPVAQSIRNIVGRLVLGLAPVEHAAADSMSEVSVCYPHSPLNGPALSAGPKPGTRLVPIVGQAPPGSGTSPHFALFAPFTPATAALMEQFSPLLDQNLRPPIRQQALWLIRPDGYVACAAAIGEEHVIARYLTGQLSRSSNVV